LGFEDCRHCTRLAIFVAALSVRADLPDTACHFLIPLIAESSRRSHFNLRAPNFALAFTKCLKIGQANPSFHLTEFFRPHGIVPLTLIAVLNEHSRKLDSLSASEDCRYSLWRHEGEKRSKKF
jgi:hypothetical protein